MEVADELFIQIGEVGAQVSIDATPVMLPLLEKEDLSLSDNLKKTHGEAIRAKAKLDVLQAAARLASKQHNVALEKVREEPHHDAEAWKVRKSRTKTNLAKVHEETSDKTGKLRFERDRAAARYPELLSSLCRVFVASEEQKDKVADILVDVQNIHDDGRKGTLETHEAKWGGLRQRVTCLTNRLESKSKDLHTIPGLVMEAARLWQEFSEAGKEAER